MKKTSAGEIIPIPFRIRWKRKSKRNSSHYRDDLKLQFDRHQPYIPMISRDMYNAHRTVYKDFPQRCFGDCHCIWWHFRNCYHNNIKEPFVIKWKKKWRLQIVLSHRHLFFLLAILLSSLSRQYDVFRFVVLFQIHLADAMSSFYSSLSPHCNVFQFVLLFPIRFPCQRNTIVIFHSLSFTSMPLFARLARNAFNVRYITLSEIQLHATRHNLLIPRNK